MALDKSSSLKLFSSTIVFIFLHSFFSASFSESVFSSKKYNIVFASHIEGNHGKSKVEFIKKWFPMTSAFAATRQKNMVKSVVNIDDRVEHLINLSKDSLPILYKTTWDNPEHSLEPQTWETISYFIKK